MTMIRGSKDALDMLIGRYKSKEELKRFILNLLKTKNSPEYHQKRRAEPFKTYSELVVSSTRNVIEEIIRDDATDKGIEVYYRMVEKDPYVRACCELKALRATIAFGQYENPNKTLQNWINDNLNNMESSLAKVVGQLCSAMPFGFAVAEILFKPMPDNTWGLKGFNVLDPRRVKFESLNNRIEYVAYTNRLGKVIRIPYKKCVHIVGGFTTPFGDPYGSPECKRAYPYYQAKQTIMAEMTIAAKNNATGIWLGYTDPNTQVHLHGPDGRPLYNSDGSPVVRSAMESLLKQLQNLENHSVIVTDSNNRIDTISLGVDASLWNFALEYMNQGIMMAFMMPRSILQESAAIWQGNMNTLQKTVLDATIESVVCQIKDEMIEKVVKPLIKINFGETNNYGSFSEMIARDPTTKAMHLQNLITAISMQLLDGTDEDVQNKVRDLLDLPELKASAESGAAVIKQSPASIFLPKDEENESDRYYIDEIQQIE